MSAEPAYTRWTADEYLRVAVNSLQFIVPGKPTIAAFVRGQKLALPRARHRDAVDLKRLAIGSDNRLAKYEAIARALSADERAKYLVPIPEKPPKPVKAASAGADPFAHGRKSQVRWTTRENALIARYVNAHRADGDIRPLTTLVIAAVEAVLPADRQRSKGGIYDMHYRGALEPALAEGTRNEWLLAEEEPAADLSPSDIADLEAPGASAAPPAPQTPPQSGSTLAEASKAFADTMARALEVLLAASAEHTLSNLSNRVAAIAQEVGTSIAAQIERGLRQTVLDTMAAELGGPVAAPSTQQAIPFPEPRAEVPDQRRKLVKVDVVGLVGNNIQLVKQAFNGNTDLRFIDPDHLNQWTPHSDRHAITATKWIPHKAKGKCKAAGVVPINVTGSVGTVIHAIEELHRNAGIPV